MTFPSDLTLSSYIIMMKGLCWQPTQSTDPSPDEVAAEEKQGDQTVCLVGIAEAETPVIQVVSL